MTRGVRAIRMEPHRPGKAPDAMTKSAKTANAEDLTTRSMNGALLRGASGRKTSRRR
jgi:hypothetical protein